MRAAGDGPDGARLCALIVMLWRARLRIGEALDLTVEMDLDRPRGAVLIRRGKGGKRREVGMDRWAWDQLQPGLEIRANFPVGALLCVIHGATGGRHWEPSAARKQLRRTAALAGVRRRFAPHQLRHAHAIEMAHEGVPLVVSHTATKRGRVSPKPSRTIHDARQQRNADPQISLKNEGRRRELRDARRGTNAGLRWPPGQAHEPVPPAQSPVLPEPVVDPGCLSVRHRGTADRARAGACRPLRSRGRRESGRLLGFESRAARDARPARVATSKQPSRCRSVAERQLSALKAARPRVRLKGSNASRRTSGPDRTILSMVSRETLASVAERNCYAGGR